MARNSRAKQTNKQRANNQMITQSAPVPFGVVPDANLYKQIQNTINAPERLADAIDAFKIERTAAEAELANSLGNDLMAAPLEVDKAIEKQRAWKVKDEALAAKIQSAQELQPIIEAQIDELKKTQPEALKTVLQQTLQELEKEVAAENDQAARLKEQIQSLKALLHELEKPANEASAKGKK